MVFQTRHILRRATIFGAITELVRMYHCESSLMSSWLKNPDSKRVWRWLGKAHRDSSWNVQYIERWLIPQDEDTCRETTHVTELPMTHTTVKKQEGLLSWRTVYLCNHFSMNMIRGNAWTSWARRSHLFRLPMKRLPLESLFCGHVSWKGMDFLSKNKSLVWFTQDHWFYWS